jgi:predicted MPP superfamily phosphohydrolase
MRRRLPFAPAVVTGVFAALLACAAGQASPRDPQAQPIAAPTAALALPNRDDSLKFAVIGDNGNGGREQYELADQMAAWHQRFAFPLVLMLGDNLYGSERPQDFARKFEIPYKALLDEGVKFYASLGNHDSREQRYYKPFNMEGKLYYSFKAPKQDVRFFALESTYMDAEQLKWIEDELKNSKEKWKICFFHHPLYSSGGRHGSELKLRAVLEPLFIKYGVSLVLNGHDHVYERVKPQHGILYFVAGSGGQLRRGDLKAGTGLTAKGDDQSQVFLMMEINGDELWYTAVDRSGQIVDSGTFQRRQEPETQKPGARIEPGA